MLAPIFARLVQLAVSRQREYLADATSVAFTRNPAGLERALARISGDPDVLEAANRATQHLYFPEHLPNADRPAGLPGASAGDRGAGLSECYGTLRVGQLAELLLYDCRRFQTLAGPHARLVPENVEQWLVGRMCASKARHVVNVPSMPIAWSAGKWGEWYPDLLDNQGRLGVAKPKYFWQEGWRSQHDRLLKASSESNRLAVFLSGDLHALAHGAIARNGRAASSNAPTKAPKSVRLFTFPSMRVPTGYLFSIMSQGFGAVCFIPSEIFRLAGSTFKTAAST